MTVWDSGLWKINIHMAKKWPELIIEQSFKSNIRFRSVFRYFLKPQVLFRSGFYSVKYSIFTPNFYQDLHLIFFKVQFWHFTSHINTVCCNFELYRCQQAEAIKEILSRDIISKKMCWKLQLINNLAIHNFSQVEPSCSLHFF